MLARISGMHGSSTSFQGCKMLLPMTRSNVLEFMRSHSLAVQASVSSLDAPQAAVVGFAVNDDFQIIFDCLDTTRKVVNLRRNPRCALVIGGIASGDERTVQY